MFNFVIWEIVLLEKLKWIVNIDEINFKCEGSRININVIL